MSELEQYLSLKSEINSLRKKVKTLEEQNSRLRKLCGMPRKNGIKKSAIMKLLEVGMEPKKIAAVVPCSISLVYEYKKTAAV